MKKHVMNKTVIHNGKKYEKGVGISKNDEGFEAITSAGHTEVIHFDAEDEASADAAAPSEAPAEVESEDEGHGKHNKRRR